MIDSNCKCYALCNRSSYYNISENFFVIVRVTPVFLPSHLFYTSDINSLLFSEQTINVFHYSTKMRQHSFDVL